MKNFTLRGLLASALMLVGAMAWADETVYYPFTLGGTRVTSDNASSLLNVLNAVEGITATGGSITVTGTARDATLTFDGVTVTSTTNTHIINLDPLYSNLDHVVTLTFNGTNSFTSSEVTYGLIYNNSTRFTTTINGTGTLTLNSARGYDIKTIMHRLTIDGTNGFQLNCQGGWDAICENNSPETLLTFKNAKMTSNGAIERMKLITLDNSKISTDGVSIVDGDYGFQLEKSNGSLSREFTIEPGDPGTYVGKTYTASVDGVQTTFIITKIDDDGGEVTIGNGTDLAVDASTTGAYAVPSTVTLDGQTYTVTKVASKAFYNVNGITSITLGDNIAIVGSDAFGRTGSDVDAANATTLTLPASLTAIGQNAFECCKWIKGVDFSAATGLTTINTSAFKECNIAELTIPEHINKVYNLAFSSNPLTSVTLENKDIQVQTNAFYSTAAAATMSMSYSVRLPATNPSVYGKYTFQPWIVLSKEMQTFSYDRAIDFTSADGLTAYVATAVDKDAATITLTSVDALPAETGAVVRGTVGTKYQLTIPATAPDAPATNYMVGNGVDVSTSVELTTNVGGTEYTSFVLSDGTFVKASAAGYLPLGKAYLRIPTDQVPAAGGDKPAVSLRFDEATDAIRTVSHDTPAAHADGAIYDLSGRRVAAPAAPGLYIDGSRRILVK